MKHYATIFKRLAMFAALALLTSQIEASEYSFVVWDKSGVQISYGLTERPKVTQTMENLVINTTTTIVEYPKTDVHKFTLVMHVDDSGTTNVDTIKENGCRFTQANNIVSLCHCDAGESVRVYTSAGVLVESKCANEDGALSIDLGYLSQGIYIIQTKSITFKTIKQ